MRNFLIKWGFNTFGILIAGKLVPGIGVHDLSSALAAAFILGLMNVFIRPVLLLLTLPLNIMSLGILTFVINGGLLYLVSKIVSGFVISGFWDAFWGALIISAIGFLLNIVLGVERGNGWHFYRKSHKVDPPGDNGNVIDVEAKCKKC